MQNQIFVRRRHKRKSQLSKYDIELEKTVTEVICESTNKPQEATVNHAEGDVKPGKLKQSANLANFDREGKRSLRKAKRKSWSTSNRMEAFDEFSRMGTGGGRELAKAQQSTNEGLAGLIAKARRERSFIHEKFRRKRRKEKH